MLVKHSRVALVGLVSLSIVLAGCGGNKSGGSGGGAAETITIGVDSELTGAGAGTYGEPENHGMEIAIDEIAAAKFLGSTTLKLDIKDDATDRTKAVQNFQLFAQDHDPVVVESAYTSILQALAPIATQNKTPVISIGAGGAGDTPDYVFRMADQNTPITAFAKFLATTKGYKNISLLLDNTNPGLVTSGESFTKAFTQAGGGSVKNVTVAATDTDFSSQITQIGAAKPDIVVVFASSPESGNFLAQAARSGQLTGIPFGGYVGWSTQVSQLAGKASVGAIFPQDWVPSSESSAFVSAFKKRFNQDPVQVSAQAHDMVWLVATAIKQLQAAGKAATGENLQGQLPTASKDPSFQQHALMKGFTMDANGAPVTPGVMATFNDSGDIVALS